MRETKAVSACREIRKNTLFIFAPKLHFDIECFREFFQSPNLFIFLVNYKMINISKLAQGMYFLSPKMDSAQNFVSGGTKQSLCTSFKTDLWLKLAVTIGSKLSISCMLLRSSFYFDIKMKLLLAQRNRKMLESENVTQNFCNLSEKHQL